MQSTPFRIGLALIYFVLVNYLSGYFAELFRYPSLWGNRDNLFGEYATPLLFTWGLAHWFSMLPATLLVAGLPAWSEQMVVRARWVAFSILLICLGIELSESINRFQKIPFILFIAVDAGLFLIIALAFYPPYRLLGGLAATGAGIAGYVLYEPGMFSSEPQPIRHEKESIFYRTNLVIDDHARQATYFVELAFVPKPGKPPSSERICREAEQEYAMLIDKEPPPRDAESVDVQFMAYGWFDESGKILFPAGTASLNGDSWQCEFIYPAWSEGDIPGWRSVGNTWIEKGGEWIAPGDSGPTYLASRNTYQDVRITLEFMPDREVNSGVFVRCADPDNVTPKNCYEANIWDRHPQQKFRTGSLVSRVAPPLVKVFTTDQWNEMTVLAEGGRIAVWVNGELTAELTGEEPRAGHVVLQQAGKGRVRFRKVEVKPVN